LRQIRNRIYLPQRALRFALLRPVRKFGKRPTKRHRASLSARPTLRHLCFASTPRLPDTTGPRRPEPSDEFVLMNYFLRNACPPDTALCTTRPRRRARAKFALAMQDPRQDSLGLQMPPCPRRTIPARLYSPAPKISNRATPGALLSRPASFWEYQPPCVRGATKQTCQFERLAAFRPRRHPPRELQSVGRAGIPIKPVDQVLRRFFAHRSVELLLPDLLASSNSKTPVRVMFIPGFASHGIAGWQK
jgi:hypothetical protein